MSDLETMTGHFSDSQRVIMGLLVENERLRGAINHHQQDVALAGDHSAGQRDADEGLWAVLDPV